MRVGQKPRKKFYRAATAAQIAHEYLIIIIIKYNNNNRAFSSTCTAERFISCYCRLRARAFAKNTINLSCDQFTAGKYSTTSDGMQEQHSLVLCYHAREACMVAEHPPSPLPGFSAKLFA